MMTGGPGVFVCRWSRQLLEEVSAFEQTEFADDLSSETRPVPLRYNSFDDRLSDTQRIVSLSMVSK